MLMDKQAITSALAADIRFTSGNSALKIPFDLYNNHIYLQVSVNGSKPLSFLFDTGAPQALSLKAVMTETSAPGFCVTSNSS